MFGIADDIFERGAFLIFIFLVIIVGITYFMFFYDQPKSIEEGMGAKNFGFAKVQSPPFKNNSSVRQCLNTERKCDGSNGCKGPDGSPIPETATNPDGYKCCSFQCESEELDRRPCKSNEKTCRSGNACKMENTLVSPAALTNSGLLCCKYDCVEDFTVVRACFPTESVCPSGSYCYDYSDNIVVPNAYTSNGKSCCVNVTQNGSPCVTI